MPNPKHQDTIPDPGPYPCQRCHETANANYLSNRRMVERNLCFTCNFWDQHAEHKDSPLIARIHGTHYVIGDENPSNPFRGFGGNLFVIVFHDHERAPVITTNLWCQGDIPPLFQAELPNNAVFIREPRQFLAALQLAFKRPS